MFLDTSALVKYYVDEPGSVQVRTAWKESDQVAVSALISPELASALWRLVREDRLDHHEAVSIQSEWWRDCQMCLEIGLDSGLGQVGKEAARFCQVYGLRGADAVHLSSALQVLGQHHRETHTFLSADERLRSAALAEGLIAPPVA